MKLFKKLSLRGKLVVLLLVTSAGALFLSAFGFALNDLLSFREAMFDRLHAQAEILGANTRAALLFEDADSAAATLSSLKSESRVVAGAVYGPGGELFAAFEREPGSVPSRVPPRDEGYLDADVFVLSSVVAGGEQVGVVFVRMRTSEWSERQIQHVIIATGVMGVTLLLVFFLANRLQGIVSEPILHLAETARRISRTKSYELRAEKLSRDEIGHLVDDFNGMLEQIQARDEMLRRHREQLEEEVQDRTADLVSMARQLEYQAFHDTLTGLANRSLFDDHLVEAIALAERTGGALAVLFLDLDRFKVINDTLGHAVGDRLLVQVAERFKARLRRSDTIARLGGDEFAVLLNDLKHPEYAGEVSRKLLESMEPSFQVEGYSLHLTTSVGISLYPADGVDAESILKNADAAMYRSKELGRNRFKFFSSEMNVRAVRRLSLENRLRRAVQMKEFEVWYQPRCDAVTREVLALEALVRWRDPAEGLVMPGEFIPLAEDCGLIVDIDEWVVQTACRQVLAWYGGDPQLSLAVNLSASHFVRENLPEVLQQVLAETGYPPDRLELEITESVVGPAYSDTCKTLETFKARGIKLSIDDFGTGYSSLSRLKQLPIHTIKIDQSFVRDLGMDADDEAITRTIIAMAHSMNLRVVAEGVETEAQYHFVRSHGCNEVQGFLFGRPMPAAECAAVLGLARKESV